MLSKYDMKLTELREKMARRGKTEAMISELKRQRTEIALREEALRQELEREQADVDRLNEGFRSIYYAIIGKKEAMLENEQAEVRAVSVKYEAARQELKCIDDQIEQLSWDLSDMANAETRYRETLDEKLDAMRKAGIEAEKLLPIDEKLHLMSDKLREVEQAYTAGRKVVGVMDNIENELYEAEKYGRIDLYGLNKSSMFSQVGKYVHFDNAQHHAKHLQRFVDEFQKELADISVAAEVYVHIDGFTRFADWFFDGIFADLAALRRIEESQNSVRTARMRIERIIDRLEEMKRELERQSRELRRELYKIAENAG